MNTPSAADVLKLARQCNCLLDVLRTELNDAEIDQREAELIGLAADVAARVFVIFWTMPMRPGFGEAADTFELSGAAGKLRAVTAAMCDAVSRVHASAAEHERRELGEHIGWLQYLASDVAGHLVGEIEQAIAAASPGDVGAAVLPIAA